MKPFFRPGDIVLYDSCWNHSDSQRPFIVLMREGGDLLLCPLTSSGQMRADLPLKPRAGGLRYRSWVAATDYKHQVNNLKRVNAHCVEVRIGQLTQNEFHAVQITAITQVKKQKAFVKRFAVP